MCVESDAPFIVDDGQLPDADLKRLYYDWDKLREIDPYVQTAGKPSMSVSGLAWQES